MEKILHTYLEYQRIGTLTQNAHGLLSFCYTAEWLQNSEAKALSLSLPLSSREYKGQECHAFFGGILPEYEKRELIAKNLGVSARNDFSLLEKIGGECAGAVMLLPPDMPPPLPSILQADYRLLSEEDLERILFLLPSQPLLAGTQDVRLSLAGA
jgi:serine/threonine-protein kinase HipA